MPSNALSVSLKLEPGSISEKANDTRVPYFEPGRETHKFIEVVL